MEHSRGASHTTTIFRHHLLVLPALVVFYCHLLAQTLHLHPLVVITCSVGWSFSCKQLAHLSQLEARRVVTCSVWCVHVYQVVWLASRSQAYFGKRSGYRSGSQLSKIILNNTYTLRYVSYTYYFILGLGLGLGLILYYFAELAAGPISTSFGKLACNLPMRRFVDGGNATAHYMVVVCGGIYVTRGAHKRKLIWHFSRYTSSQFLGQFPPCSQ